MSNTQDMLSLTGNSAPTCAAPYLPSFWPSPVKALKAPLGFTKSSSRWSSMSKFTCPPWANLRSSAGTSLQEKMQCWDPHREGWEWQWEYKLSSENHWASTESWLLSWLSVASPSLLSTQRHGRDLYLFGHLVLLKNQTEKDTEGFRHRSVNLYLNCTKSAYKCLLLK